MYAKFGTFVRRVTDSRFFALKPPDYKVSLQNLTLAWARRSSGMAETAEMAEMAETAEIAAYSCAL